MFQCEGFHVSLRVSGLRVSGLRVSGLRVSDLRVSDLISCVKSVMFWCAKGVMFQGACFMVQSILAQRYIRWTHLHEI